jgi:hypothetical protein
MSQAIITKYLGPTNHRPSRIKATSWRDSVTLPLDHALNAAENYRAAAQALCDKINDGITPRLRDAGAWKITTGGELPNEARDFVFVIDWVAKD